MLSVKLVLVLLALILFALAAIGVPSGRLGLVPAGLFCWLLSTAI